MDEYFALVGAWWYVSVAELLNFNKFFHLYCLYVSHSHWNISKFHLFGLLLDRHFDCILYTVIDWLVHESNKRKKSKIKPIFFLAKMILHHFLFKLISSNNRHECLHSDEYQHIDFQFFSLLLFCKSTFWINLSDIWNGVLSRVHLFLLEVLNSRGCAAIFNKSSDNKIALDKMNGGF